jgi:uncharacterized protein (DUF2236 family)
MIAEETSTQEFQTWLEELSRKQGDPIQGFFGPQSLVWQVNQELALHIAGPRALLLQLAHPMVAQGVADHSNFKEDFWGRAIRTFSTVYSMVFGTQEHAIKAASRIHMVHTKITGTLDEDVGRFKAGTPYYANDPNLLRWVYATLVGSALNTYEEYIQPNSPQVVEQSYLEMRAGARLFGVNEDWLAPSWPEFKAWMRDTILSDEIEVSSVAFEIAQKLLAGPPGLTFLAPSVRIMCAGMLSPKLRDGFGLGWNRRTRLSYGAMRRMLRVMVKRVPAPLRTVPIARSAYRRCKAQQHGERAGRLRTLLQRAIG